MTETLDIKNFDTIIKVIAKKIREELDKPVQKPDPEMIIIEKPIKKKICVDCNKDDTTQQFNKQKKRCDDCYKKNQHNNFVKWKQAGGYKYVKVGNVGRPKKIKPIEI